MTMTPEDSPPPAALAATYLSHGWAPIPLEPRGKRPLLDWKPFQATTPTPADVWEWWAKWPDANVGLVTGAVSGLVVLDLDGLAAVEEFVRRHREAGEGPMALPVVRTGKGLHLYFKHPGGTVPNRARLLAGWDIRGDGGYVVAPGSTHESGAVYRFLPDCAPPSLVSDEAESVSELPLMPVWLSALLASPPAVEQPSDGALIPEGTRNDTLYRLARSLKARGLSTAAVEVAVRAENETLCCPPLPEAELATLIANALTQPDREDYGKEQGAPADPATAIKPVLRMTRLSDVSPEAVEWLWPGYIPAGKLTLVVGDPGTGKSYMTLDLAARLTAGKPWPDGASAAPVGDVLLLQAEDGAADTVRPRFDLLGGDPSRLNLIEAVLLEDGKERAFSLDQDVERMRLVLASGAVRLLIIDPLTAYLGKADSYKDADVRQVLTPWAKLAAETGVAIVAVMHLNKKLDNPALYRAGGSIGFMAVARMALAVGRDRKDPERRLLVPIKTNLTQPASPMAFRLTEQGVGGWAPADDVDPETVLSGGAAAGGPRPAVKLPAAMAWLQGALKAGPVSIHWLKEEAKRLGHSWPTVERAKDHLRLDLKHGSGGVRLWALPITGVPISTSVGVDDEESPHHQHLP